MGVDQPAVDQLVHTLVQRGLGIYGYEKMTEICESSGVALLDDFSIDWLDDDRERALKRFLISYARQNPAARMTVLVLAKRYGVPVPKELERKKRFRAKFRRLFRR